MKIKNLFFATLAAVALIACGSEEKKSSVQENEASNIEGQYTTDLTTEDMVNKVEEVVENGDKSIPGYIVISKESMTLKLYDKNGNIIYNFPVAVGKNFGNKKVSGDMKTPEGVFEIQQIQPAATWSHDFKDGKGTIANAYGNWFIRLLTPGHNGIGIHGTHAPESIGTRATEGCIRLHNDNLDKLKPLVRIGMKVTIEPSQADLDADGKAYEPATTPTKEVAPAKEEKPATENKPATEDKAKVEPKPETESKPTVAEQQSEYFPGEIIEHTIEKDQFISHVAVKYHTTSAKIMELNPDLDPAKLKIGQKIKVQPNTDGKSTAKPAAQPAVEEDPNGTYHVIVSGDMLGKLAKTYGTTVEKIQALNPDINPTNLKLGAKIRVK